MTGSVSGPSDAEQRALVKELADAVSTQAKVSNRFWIVLMTAALVALLPRVQQSNQAEQVALPFQLGEVDPLSFHVVIFVILVTLTIAFASAHAQQVRAQKLAQRRLDLLAAFQSEVSGLHPRELFDILRLPSVNRVAPIAQYLRGKYQFFDAVPSCPRWLRTLSTWYYLLLKVVSLGIYFGLPALALWHSYDRLPITGPLMWLLTGVGAIAAVTLLQVIVADIFYVATVKRAIQASPGPPSAPRSSAKQAPGSHHEDT